MTIGAIEDQKKELIRAILALLERATVEQLQSLETFVKIYID